MNQEPQQPPYVVGVLLHIYESIVHAPKMIFETLLGMVTAAISDADVFLLVAGLVILGLFLPWELVVGGGLVFYATLRTVNAWLNNISGSRREEVNLIAEVIHTGNQSEKRVVIVQVPEVLTRRVGEDDGA